MRIYLDVSCLNRPFDDPLQPRVRREAEAVLLILLDGRSDRWQLVSSVAAIAEVEAIPDPIRRARVLDSLPPEEWIHPLSESNIARSLELRNMGFKRADALHIAAAEECADVFLTCDDRMIRTARRYESQLTVDIDNPVTWMERHGTADDA